MNLTARLYHDMKRRNMQQQLDFNNYPNSPGYKKSGTSKLAARAIKPRVNSIRNQVYEVLQSEALTADEVAEALDLSILTVRPRCSELLRMGLIEETGTRRLNDSGKLAEVLRAKQ